MPLKAIIPVAGAGTMLRPHTHTQPKALIPVAGRPILSHIIEALLEADVQEFVFVIGYLGEKIRAYVEDTYSGDKRLTYHFAHQEKRLGLAHAIWMGREAFTSDDDHLVIALGDTILDANISEILHREGSLVCVHEVETPSQFGIAAIDASGVVQSLVEKPAIPKSNLALVGLYKIEPARALFKAIEELMQTPAQNGEYHLADALMALVKQGVEIQTVRVKSWYDCGEKPTVLETNRLLLNRLTNPPDPQKAKLENSVIIPPVYIPPTASITDSIIGPYVALGPNAHIEGSIVQNSILGEYSRLKNIILKDSLVGNDTTLVGRWQAINLGDNTEIDFNT